MRDELSALPSEAALWNACVAALTDGFALQGRGRALLRLAPDIAPDGSPSFAVTMPDGPIWLQLRQLPLAAMTRSSLTTDSLAALPPALADAVVGVALDALRQAVGRAAQEAVVRVDRIAPDALPAGGERILAEVDGGWGETALVLVVAERATLTGVTRGLVAGMPRPAFPEAVARHIPVACGLRLSRRDLPQARLAGLRPGDIILPQGPDLSLWTPHARFALGQDGSNWTITEVAMTDEFPETPPQGSADASPAPDIGALPVRLSFLLAEQTLTLAELQTLAVGAMLPFAPEMPQAGRSVRILANGRAIGHGNVVEVEGQPAVRIARLFGTD